MDLPKPPWWIGFPFSFGFGLMGVFAPDVFPDWVKTALFGVGAICALWGAMASIWHYRNSWGNRMATTILILCLGVALIICGSFLLLTGVRELAKGAQTNATRLKGQTTPVHYAERSPDDAGHGFLQPDRQTTESNSEKVPDIRNRLIQAARGKAPKTLIEDSHTSPAPMQTDPTALNRVALGNLINGGEVIRNDFEKTGDTDRIKKEYSGWVTDATNVLVTIDPTYIPQFNQAHAGAMGLNGKSVEGSGYWDEIRAKSAVLSQILSELRNR
jgi:hypothetical protein